MTNALEQITQLRSEMRELRRFIEGVDRANRQRGPEPAIGGGATTTRDGKMDATTQVRFAYRYSEVAAAFGVHVDTVHTWIKGGHMRTIKVGKTHLVPQCEIDRLLSEETAS